MGSSISGSWHDLTRRITRGMPVYPGDPEVAIRTHALAETVQLTELSLSCHSGTHLDAPRHFLPGGLAVDELPLERLIGPAWVVDLRDAAQPYALSPDFWRAAEPGDALLFCTGWSAPAPWQNADFPRFAADVEQWLREAHPWLVGLDVPTLAQPDDPDGADAHRLLLGAGILLAENLTGLVELVGRRVELFVLPLPIAGADGAPARVIARELAVPDSTMR